MKSFYTFFIITLLFFNLNTIYGYDEDTYISHDGFKIDEAKRFPPHQRAMASKKGGDVPIKNRLSALGFEESIYTSEEIEKEKKDLKKGFEPPLRHLKPTNYGSLSIMGMTGFIELPNATVLNRGEVAMGTHFLRYRKSANTIWSHKMVYGISKNTEVGLAILDVQNLSSPSKVFNVKRKLFHKDNVNFSFLYEYIDPNYQSEGIHNLSLIVDFDVRDYLKISTDTVYSSDNGDTLTFNVGMELKVPGTPEHSASIMIEWGQDAAQKYSKMNFGLRYYWSDIAILDLYRFKNFLGNEDCSGLGLTLKF
jgi:hypothetical protein